MLAMFRGVPPVQTLREGDMIGEAALLQEEPLSATSVVTTETVEIIELKRQTFEAVLKDDVASARGQMLSFLQALPILRDAPMAEAHGLASSVVMKSFERAAYCLAYPPDAALGCASFSHACVCIIYRGEARLLAAPAAPAGAGAGDGALHGGSGSGGNNAAPPDATAVDAREAATGPLSKQASPGNRAIEAALGGALLPIATLGPGEIILSSVLGDAASPPIAWCLQPTTALEVMIIPKTDFQSVVRAPSISRQRSLINQRAVFFHQRIAAAQVEAGTMQLLAHPPDAPRDAATTDHGGVLRTRPRSAAAAATARPGSPPPRPLSPKSRAVAVHEASAKRGAALMAAIAAKAPPPAVAAAASAADVHAPLRPGSGAAKANAMLAAALREARSGGGTAAAAQNSRPRSAAAGSPRTRRVSKLLTPDRAAAVKKAAERAIARGEQATNAVIPTAAVVAAPASAAAVSLGGVAGRRPMLMSRPGLAAATGWGVYAAAPSRPHGAFAGTPPPLVAP